MEACSQRLGCCHTLGLTGLMLPLSTRRWSETKALEAELAEAHASAKRAEAAHRAELEAQAQHLFEAREAIAAQESQHEQALARAKADRRVLARHSRDFLDGKHAVEKDKAALEAQVTSSSLCAHRSSP